MGPAMVAPVPAVTSGVVFTITATATRGALAGAKAVIQACERGGSRVSCAVPVLAAACTPLASCMQQRAVPLLTTSIIAWFRKASVAWLLVAVCQGRGW